MRNASRAARSSQALAFGPQVLAIALRCLAIERGSMAIGPGGSAVFCRRLAVRACGKASLVFGFRQRVVSQPIANRRVYVATLGVSVATLRLLVATLGFRVATLRVRVAAVRELLALIVHERSVSPAGQRITPAPPRRSRSRRRRPQAAVAAPAGPNERWPSSVTCATARMPSRLGSSTHPSVRPSRRTSGPCAATSGCTASTSGVASTHRIRSASLARPGGGRRPCQNHPTSPASEHVELVRPQEAGGCEHGPPASRYLVSARVADPLVRFWRGQFQPPSHAESGDHGRS